MSATPPLRVLLGVGGGIAAFKAAQITRRLRERGHQVRCAMTEHATAFLTPLTLEVLSTEPVYRQEYLRPTDSGEELHITAALWADVLCVAPTTCNLLAKLAQGLADDFLTTTALACTAPLVLAPAMHHHMWNHSAVRANVDLLRRRDVVFAGPVEGLLASGEQGQGRLADPEDIVLAIEAAAYARQAGRGVEDGSSSAGASLAAGSSLATSSSLATGRTLIDKNVVISAGPTHEPVDSVRYLGNHSSGKMGFALAAEAARRGARVQLVAGPTALPTPEGVERIDVTTALQMQQAVHDAVEAADLVIMSAAVADFRPARPADRKLKKEEGVPQIELQQNPDILAGLADVAPQAVRVGFAAETNDLESNALSKLERKRAHMVVANDVSRQDIGFSHDSNEVIVYRRDGEPVFLSRRPKTELAEALLDLFAEVLEAHQTGARDPGASAEAGREA